MSEFFKALEQAERDRALGQEARPAVTAPAEAPAAVEAAAPTTVRRPAPEPAPREMKAPLDLRPPVEVKASQEDEAREGIDGHMVSLVTPTGFEAEQYRTLRHMIEELHASAQLSIIACTSPAGGDGKTTTAINLAGALAQARDARVLLVDADLRRPTIARELVLRDVAGPGLVGAILNRELTLADVVRPRPPFNLSVLPAGRTSANPYELLKAPRLAQLMQEARRDYDYVVLDTPPLVGVPDCRAIASFVDGFLVVVAAHRTPRKLVEEALGTMEPAKLIGLVFNRDHHPLGGYYSYGSTSNGYHGRRWRQAVDRARDFLPRWRAR